MMLQIFDVEHGACALLTCDNGERIMIDCGHNATTEWLPGTYLRSIGVQSLDRLIITNYDEDHVSGIADLFDKVSVGSLFRNTSVEPAVIRCLKTKDGMGNGIERLMWEIEHNFGQPGVFFGPQPTFPGVKVEYFFNAYLRPFDDENNLSLVAKFNCNGCNFIFPGDLETDGWRQLLIAPGFTQTLRNLDVFIASHHGRQNGCCDDIFPFMGSNAPTFVVISDKAKGFQSQETTAYYYQRSKGGIFRGNPDRHVLTTRSDGDIKFTFSPNGYIAD